MSKKELERLQTLLIKLSDESDAEDDTLFCNIQEVINEVKYQINNK